MKKCDVDSCDRNARSAGSKYCEMHYMRLRRKGDLGPAEPMIGLTECGVDGCDEYAHSKASGFCKKHHTRFVRHGSPMVVLAQPIYLEDKHQSWIGDGVGYIGAHGRVRRSKGSASLYSCVACGAPAAHWAYDHEDVNEMAGSGKYEGMPYSPNPDHYKPMCVSCHKDFDLGRSVA